MIPLNGHALYKPRKDSPLHEYKSRSISNKRKISTEKNLT